MARSSVVTKRRILEAAYELFYRVGFGRVSMDAIADAAGVTKRTLYYHFESKDALVSEALQHRHLQVLELFQGWGKATAGSPAEYLRGIFREFERWAATPRWLGSGFTRLTMELADLPGHPARAAADRHKHALAGWLAEELRRLGAREAERLAAQTMLLLEGCQSLVLIHGDTRFVRIAEQAACRLAEAEEP